MLISVCYLGSWWHTEPYCLSLPSNWGVLECQGHFTHTAKVLWGAHQKTERIRNANRRVDGFISRREGKNEGWLYTPSIPPLRFGDSRSDRSAHSRQSCVRLLFHPWSDREPVCPAACMERIWPPSGSEIPDNGSIFTQWGDIYSCAF